MKRTHHLVLDGFFAFAMVVEPEVGIGALALVATLITYAISHNHDRRIQRAELVRALTRDFYERPAVAKVFMAIDHDQLEVSEDIVGTNRELDLVQFLDFINAVGHNWSKGVLPMDDLMHTTLGYASLRAYRDPGVRRYLGFVERWDRERFLPGQGFHYVRALGEELERRCGPLGVGERSESPDSRQ